MTQIYIYIRKNIRVTTRINRYDNYEIHKFIITPIKQNKHFI